MALPNLYMYRKKKYQMDVMVVSVERACFNAPADMACFGQWQRSRKTTDLVIMTTLHKARAMYLLICLPMVLPTSTLPQTHYQNLTKCSKYSQFQMVGNFHFILTM